MTRVVAPSRLHFGLLRAARPRADGGTRFGGCGLMIDSPGVAVAAEPADAWHATGPNRDRALDFALRVTDTPHRIAVERCPSEHIGLGVGTSLGLAVAKAIHPEWPTAELARMLGRGQRSGVGLHGFESGGFIIDGGKDCETGLPRLTKRIAFPAEWRVVIIIPDQPANWFGPAEHAAFARIRERPHTEVTAERMEALLTHDLGPALEAEDCPRFTAALGEYNRLAGEPFADEQGGMYAGRMVSALIATLAGLGFPGVGQSSWGPTVFAISPDPDRGAHLAETIRNRFGGLRSVEVVAAARRGAVVETIAAG